MADKQTDRRTDFNDPDRQNSEQQDEQEQAQAYADAALHDAWHERMSQGSTKERGRDPTLVLPTNEQDVIDHMADMDQSGRIDMDAFAGEPEGMDDEDGSGQTGAPEKRANKGTEEVSDDELKRGLTPSQMMAGEEPAEKTRVKGED